MGTKGAEMTGVNRGTEYPLLCEILQTVSETCNLSCSNYFCLASCAGPDRSKRQMCAWRVLAPEINLFRVGKVREVYFNYSAKKIRL